MTSESSVLSEYAAANDDCLYDTRGLEIADEQAEILHKGKIIEKFIADWAETNPPDTCFKLLQVLFRLFKSEVSANITLRQGMVTLKRNSEIAARCERQMNRLFGVAQRYSSDVSNLSQVLSLYKRCRETGDAKQLKEQLRQTTEEYKTKKAQLDGITAELEEQRKRWDEKARVEAAAAEGAMKEEQELRTRLYSLQHENADLLDKLAHGNEEADEADLKRMIAAIDSRMVELKERIRVVNQKHHEKSRSLKAQLERLTAETDDMTMQKRGMERALDLIHEKIDMFTNPLTACDDTSLSPHMARVRLGEVVEAVEQKRRELSKEESEIQELVKNIQNVKATMKAVTSEIDGDEEVLKKLITERENKEIEVRDLEVKKAEVCEKTEILDAVERTKRAVDADNIRLRQELEAVKARARQLVISHQSLLKSADVNEVTIRNAEREKQATAMSSDDSRRFDDVLNCFKVIREAYHLSEQTSLRDISNAVHSRLVSVSKDL